MGQSLNITNNIAYNNTQGGFLMDAPSLPQDEDAILYNNIAYGNGIQDLRKSDTLAVQLCDYNFWGDGKFVSGQDNHSLFGDPNCANPDGVIDVNFPEGYSIDQKLAFIRNQIYANFALTSDSRAINAGRIISGYTNDQAGDEAGDDRIWYGTAPDMGALEVALSAVTNLSFLSSSQNSLTFRWSVPLVEGTMQEPTYYENLVRNCT